MTIFDVAQVAVERLRPMHVGDEQEPYEGAPG